MGFFENIHIRNKIESPKMLMKSKNRVDFRLTLMASGHDKVEFLNAGPVKYAPA